MNCRVGAFLFRDSDFCEPESLAPTSSCGIWSSLPPGQMPSLVMGPTAVPHANVATQHAGVDP